jgi:hypothetical protein
MKNFAYSPRNCEPRIRNICFKESWFCKVVLLCRLPVKQHITEEKMAAHLSQLHISPDYTAHQPEPPREDQQQQQQLKRLVLCDELRKLKQEPILPSCLLSRLWVNFYCHSMRVSYLPALGSYTNLYVLIYMCFDVSFESSFIYVLLYSA